MSSRDETTDAMYPDMMTADEFMDELAESRQAFVDNMTHLARGPLYAEDWYILFGAWMEFLNGKKVIDEG